MARRKCVVFSGLLLSTRRRHIVLCAKRSARGESGKRFFGRKLGDLQRGEMAAKTANHKSVNCEGVYQNRHRIEKKTQRTSMPAPGRTPSTDLDGGDDCDHQHHSSQKQM